MNKRLKVILVSATIPPAFAGAGLQWYRYARRLHERNELAFLLSFDFTGKDILCDDFQPDVPETKIIRLKPMTQSNPGRIIHQVRRFLFQLSLFGRIAGLMISHRRDFDVVHATSRQPLCVFALFWARILGKVAIYETSLGYSDDLLTIKKGSYLKYWFLSRVHTVLAISPQLYELCLQSGIRKNKLRLIKPYPKDTDLFKPVNDEDKKGLRRRLNLPLDVPILLFVGVILERKGADLLPEIYRNVLKSIPTAVLVLVGPETKAILSGSVVTTGDYIRSELNEHLQNGSVIFTGAVSNVPEYMQASDIFIFPSRNEGLPNAPIEAMACGLPCVVRDIPGVTSTFIDNSVDGYIIPGDDPSGFARVIVGVLSDKSEYMRIAHKARQKVMDNWSTDSGDRQYMDLYMEYIR
ncbi:glycosyltransferase family 4 protein [bacterium]|nr:glycosyltransferase family 4 protein [candidate division CSSED10-310 bacterium]